MAQMDPLHDPALQTAPGPYHTLAAASSYDAQEGAYGLQATAYHDFAVDSHQQNRVHSPANPLHQSRDQFPNPSITIPHGRRTPVNGTSKRRSETISPRKGSPARSNPRKKNKVSQACDRCRTNKMRCGRDVSSSEDDCDNCKKVNKPCVYDRTPRKRGPIAGHVKLLHERVEELEGMLHDYRHRSSSLEPPEHPQPLSVSPNGAVDGVDELRMSFGYHQDDQAISGDHASLNADSGSPATVRSPVTISHHPSTDPALLALSTIHPLVPSLNPQPSIDDTAPTSLSYDTLQRAIEASERVTQMLRATVRPRKGTIHSAQLGTSVDTPSNGRSTNSGTGGLQDLANLAVGADATGQQVEPAELSKSINADMQAVRQGLTLLVHAIEDRHKGSCGLAGVS